MVESFYTCTEYVSRERMAPIWSSNQRFWKRIASEEDDTPRRLPGNQPAGGPGVPCLSCKRALRVFSSRTDQSIWISVSGTTVSHYSRPPREETCDGFRRALAASKDGRPRATVHERYQEPSRPKELEIAAPLPGEGHRSIPTSRSGKTSSFLAGLWRAPLPRAGFPRLKNT